MVFLGCMVSSSFYKMWFSPPVSSKKKTCDLRRVVQANRLGEHLRQAAPSRIRSKSLMCTVLFLVRLHFFTGFHDRGRFLGTRTVSMSAEFRSFLLSMCTGAPESDNKFSFLLSRGWCWKTPNIRGREEYCFVLIFELVHAFGQFPTISAGTSLLS